MTTWQKFGRATVSEIFLRYKNLFVNSMLRRILTLSLKWSADCPNPQRADTRNFLVLVLILVLDFSFASLSLCGPRSAPRFRRASFSQFLLEQKKLDYMNIL